MSGSYVNIQYKDGEGKTRLIPMPLTSAAANYVLIGLVSGALLSLKPFWNSYNKYVASKSKAMDEAWDNEDFQNAFDNAFNDELLQALGSETESTGIELGADLAEDAVSEGLAAATDAAAETAAGVAGVTSEIPFVDIGTAAVAVIIAAVSGLIRMVERVRNNNATTFVFMNSIPDTYLVFRPQTQHGVWSPVMGSNGAIISGSDSDAGIASIHVKTDNNLGAMQSFTIEPRLGKCQGRFVVEVRSNETGNILYSADGDFFNPLAQRGTHSTYNCKSNNSTKLNVTKTQMGLKDNTLHPLSKASREESLYDVVVFNFMESLIPPAKFNWVDNFSK